MAWYAKYDGVDGSLKAPAGADEFEFGADGARPAEFLTGDWNGDGVTDGSDFLRWLKTMDATPEADAIVQAYPAPEYDFARGAEADAQGIIAILIH